LEGVDYGGKFTVKFSKCAGERPDIFDFLWFRANFEHYKQELMDK